MQIDNDHGKLGKATLHSDDFSTEEPTARVEQATSSNHLDNNGTRKDVQKVLTID